MPPDVTALAHRLLRDPLRIEVSPPTRTADRIAQSVHFVGKDDKRDLLVLLLQDPALERVLVFTRTKHGADRVVKHLKRADLHAHAIHGNKSQNARERALDDFRDGRAHVLVATDIAARGIDVKDISHVINFDLPNVPESYVHRIGRTARAGRDGIAISFCDASEREYLRDIEKLIRQRIPVAQRPAGERPVELPRAAAPARSASDNPWAAAVEAPVAEAAEPAVAVAAESPPKQRQRPEPRKAPGPYEPAPEPQRPARPHREPHERRHQHRPATPAYVDPEQRRPKPKQDPAPHGPRPSEQHPHHRKPRPQGHRGPKPHGGGHGPGHHGPGHRHPASHGGHPHGGQHRPHHHGRRP